MKSEEIREMATTELLLELEESRKELFNIRRDLALRKFKNHQRLSAVKKDIARIMTVVRERELMAKYGVLNVEEGIVAGAPAVATVHTPRRRAGLLARIRRTNRNG